MVGLSTFRLRGWCLVGTLCAALSCPPSIGLAQDEPAVPEGEPSGGEPDSPQPPEGEQAAPSVDETAEPTVTEPPAPTGPRPIPTAEIGRRIEETFRDLQDAAPRLRRQRATLQIRRALPNFVEEVTRLGNEPALERLESLPPGSLNDLEEEWDRVGARLTHWQETLEARGAALSEERERIVRSRREWDATLDVEREEPLPESQRVRIETLRERIEAVIERIDLRQEEVVGLQGELSDEGIRIARVVARIRSAQRLARDRRQRRDHRPLWRGWSRLDEVPSTPSLAEVFAEHRASVGTFVYTEKNPIGWHIGLLLLAGLLLYVMRTRTRSRLTPGRRPSAQRTIRARPIASALLLALVVAPIAYRYVPVSVVGVSLILLIPVIVRLSAFLLPEGQRPMLTLVGLAGAAVPMSLGFIPAPARRYYLLLLLVAALGGAVWFWLPQMRATTRPSHRGRRQLYDGLRLMVVPLACALYFLLSGYIERAELWGVGTLWAIEQAIGLYIAAELLTALIAYGARRPWARIFHTVRTRRRKVVRIFRTAIRWGALVCFFYLALTSFDLLDPTLEASRRAFQQTFEFGSIELSFGDIVAFLMMLVGTFLTMRLVHALLEHEVLPRFDLEQGISSAISLSVSYLLVAIGVVLAFGVAGVGPERLALLGGALGVGIGFGLQNVVSNFVSGLILVAERPIKVGDIIELRELVGEVQRIGIRSSTVRSLNGAEVIVPNSDLISGRLVNWTLSDTTRRLELVVGTTYEQPPERVMQILTKVVRSQPGILNDPPPDVICQGFGDSAIEYVVRAWAPSYLAAVSTKSRLASRVYEALRAEGIEIPFPQRDLHVRSVSPQLVDAMTTASRESS